MILLSQGWANYGGPKLGTLYLPPSITVGGARAPRFPRLCTDTSLVSREMTATCINCIPSAIIAYCVQPRTRTLLSDALASSFSSLSDTVC